MRNNEVKDLKNLDFMKHFTNDGGNASVMSEFPIQKTRIEITNEKDYCSVEQNRKSLLGKVLDFKRTYYDLNIFLVSEIYIDRKFVLFYV